jgi:hypothetical protein
LNNTANAVMIEPAIDEINTKNVKIAEGAVLNEHKKYNIQEL